MVCACKTKTYEAGRDVTSPRESAKNALELNRSAVAELPSCVSLAILQINSCCQTSSHHYW